MIADRLGTGVHAVVSESHLACCIMVVGVRFKPGTEAQDTYVVRRCSEGLICQRPRLRANLITDESKVAAGLRVVTLHAVPLWRDRPCVCVIRCVRASVRLCSVPFDTNGS